MKEIWKSPRLLDKAYFTSVKYWTPERRQEARTRELTRRKQELLDLI